MKRYLLAIVFGLSALSAHAENISVLDNEAGIQTACGSDRTGNLSQPWVTATWSVTKGYDIRLPMDSLITDVAADGKFTFCLDALISALDHAEALGMPASLTLFPSISQEVVDYGISKGEPTWIFTDQNPRHPEYGIPVTRLVPWSATAMRAQKETYDAIRSVVVRRVSNGTTIVCTIVGGRKICKREEVFIDVSRIKYLVASPLSGLRYLRKIAGENDVATLPDYSRTLLENTVKAGYAAARGLAPMQFHEIYEYSDATGSVSPLAVEWARSQGDVGIFIENLQPSQPTCAQGHGKIMCEAGLPVVFEMLKPFGADVTAAINWGKTLSPNILDTRIYVGDANLFSGTTATLARTVTSQQAMQLSPPAGRPNARGGARKSIMAPSR